MRVQTGKEFTEKIIMGLFFLGAAPIIIPLFTATALPEILRMSILSKKEKRCFSSTFSRLKKQGLIKTKNINGQIYISLTKEGKRKAGKYQINDLEIRKPPRWDNKWRVLIFDITNEQKIKREALRGKIKELGMFQLQKSVWIYPYDFSKEIKMLRDFFGLTENEMQIIIADKIENDSKAKMFFKLN